MTAVLVILAAIAVVGIGGTSPVLFWPCAALGVGLCSYGVCRAWSTFWELGRP